MIAWKDITSYKQGERGKVEPRILETEINGIRIRIHRHKDYEKTWLLSCYKMNMEKIDLQTNDFAEAKKTAFKLIIDKIDCYLEVKNELLQIID